MIDNKQINIWRGSSPPPTIYHIWINNKDQILKYNEVSSQWEVILDEPKIIQDITQILEYIDKVDAYTINGKKISTNPVLNSSDINLKNNGTFITTDVETSLHTLDQMLDTKIIE